MNDELKSTAVPQMNRTDMLKSRLIILLTLIFVSLYAAALFGWLHPPSENITVARLEQIIFVIIGYYFGRIPAQQTEKTLKEEINRQTQKAVAAGQSNIQALLERESLEEKIKNTKIVLTSSPHSSQIVMPTAARDSERHHAPTNNSLSGNSIDAAIRILDS